MSKSPLPVEFGLAQATEQIGCSRSTVNRIVRKLSLGRKIGTQHVVTQADIEAIRAAVNPGPGNPEFGVKYAGPQPSSRPDAKRPGRPKKS